MTSDHNSSEFRIHNHNNELSSSKLVPKVVPLADKTTTSRQELELLFHHYITMMRLGIIPIIPTKPERRSTRRTPIDEKKQSLDILKELNVYKGKMSDKNKLNIGTITIGTDSYKDGDGDASFQLKSDSLPHAHAKTTKTYYKHQDSRIKKAQELKTKTSANSDI
ncbi:hypothetical protein Tco_1315849 [Tanacetum coccineum]